MNPDEAPGGPELPVLPELPEDAILVHIGPHKTGTTAMQTVLAKLRPQLLEHGVTYPGTKVAHHPEARALRQYDYGWKHSGVAAPEVSRWTSFAERAVEHSGRIVLSSEHFAGADADERAQLVRDLGADRVHIVLAARNPASIAVSTWQQIVRTYGRSFSLKQWLESTFRRDDPRGESNAFWARSNAAALVDQWSETVPLERITVVALDEQDRGLLPRSFEQLLGLPAGLLADEEPDSSNRGLTMTELALVRRVNAAAATRLDYQDYSLLMRRGVIRQIVEGREPPQDEGPPPLPRWASDQAAREVEHSIDALRRSGVRIAGDLETLRHAPTPPATPPRRVRSVPIDLASEAVLGAIYAATRHGPASEPARPDLSRVSGRELARALGGRVLRRVRRRARTEL